MDFKKSLKKLPGSQGVYFFFGDKGEALYIGKASNLKKRVASYFQNKHHPSRTASMVSKIRRIDYIAVPSSAEALIYEAEFIKKKRPKYNVELKDDKTYPFLRLTVGEKFPRLLIARGKKEKGSIYYGPYTSAKLLKKALLLITGAFHLRTCGNMPKRPCLKAHIKQCLSPCDGSVSESEYRKVIGEVRLFLEGRKEELLKDMSSRIKEASDGLDYEKALEIRDRMNALSAMWKGRKPPPSLDAEISGLKELLALPALPVRIEAFDISNMSGMEAVGSMVRFFNGKPQRGEYKRFRIKGITGVDDYAMMREVIRRRYTRLIKEKEDFPDLVIIDGGRGHLNAAKTELENITPVSVPVISIAKGKESIYVPGKTRPIILSKRAPALKLIMKMRDEAHRFAVSYHKLLRGKTLLRSALDEIKGIGKKRKKALINHLGSLGGVKGASLSELKKVSGIDEKTAKEIFNHFSG